MQRRRKLIRALLYVAAAALFVFSAGNVIEYSQETKTSSDYNGGLIEQVVDISLPSIQSPDETSITPSDENTENTLEIQEEETQSIVLEEAPISVDFEALTKENADVVGWLYCPETPINYPVVQSNNNEYYLRRLLNGDWNTTGSLFMDYRNNPANMDWNTVVYGHNMKNDSMFGTLPLYKSQDYYEQHPVIYFLTPEVEYKIELISGYVTPSDSALYDIYLSEPDRTQIIMEILNSSDFVSQTILEGERLFTLSTCSYEYDTARYVVIGKMIEIAKSIEQKTN